MATFDAPSREICAIKRVRTNTPLQSFVTLNDPVYVEAAQALARRIVREGGMDVRARVRYGLQLCLCRPPEPEQVEPLVALFEAEFERYRTDSQAAAALSGAARRSASRRDERGRAGRLDHGRQRALESRRRLDQRLIPMDMDLPLTLQLAQAHTRRQFLKTSQDGAGRHCAGLAARARSAGRAATEGRDETQGRGAAPNPACFGSVADGAQRPPHFAPKAKTSGLPAYVGRTTPARSVRLQARAGQAPHAALPGRAAQEPAVRLHQGASQAAGHAVQVSRRAASAARCVSELLPHLRGVVDDIAIVKSMYTDQFNHAPAELFLYTGSSRNGGAAMGSWITYGLGTENQDLPGFIVLISGGTDPTGGKALWSTGFLPSVYQGVQCRTVGDPVLYVNDPKGMDRDDRRRTLDALRKLNEYELSEFGDPETLTRISQYELAFRMQMAVPDVMDIRQEPARILEEYGAKPGASSFANNCLLARRLLERGVRYVQLFDWGWDCHGTGAGDDIVKHLPEKCKDVDRPIAALLTDLKRRGLLEDTLVIWGGEFGRTSMNEARGGSTFLGRDHHPHCFTIWLAGGGIKPGITVGDTDSLGYNIAENPVSIHDLQATILHLLGLDAWKLTYAYQGLNQKLIGPEGEAKIRKELLA